MKRSIVAACSSILMPTSVLADVVRLEWPTDAKAHYYEGTLADSGARFRTRNTWILLNAGEKADSIHPYYQDGTFGPALNILTSTTAEPLAIASSTKAVEDFEDAESEYNEYLASATAGTDNYDSSNSVNSREANTSLTINASERSPRTWHVHLASTLGNESISAQGGYSKFDGDAIIGGARGFLLTSSSQSAWSFGLHLEWRQYQFDQIETNTTAPEDDNTTKTDLSLITLGPVAGYEIWQHRNHSITGRSGITYRALPRLTITDDTRGETRLQIANAMLLRGTLVYQFDRPKWQLATELVFEPLSIASNDKASSYSAQASYRRQFEDHWKWFVEGTYTATKAASAIDCPDVVNTVATCERNTITTDTITLAALGLERRI